MSDLPATSALGLSPGRCGRTGGTAGVRVREIDGRALVLVAARKQRLDALKQTVHSQFGIALPDTPLRARGPELTFLWNGHGQWLVMDDARSPADLEHLLHDEIGGLASLVDQSDARAILEAGGTDIDTALAKLVPIDLHPRVFRANQTALTLFGQIAGQLTKLDDMPTYEAMVPRSFAESFWHAFAGAGAEFGIDVVWPARAGPYAGAWNSSAASSGPKRSAYCCQRPTDDV